MSKAQALSKREAVKHWQSLTPNKPLAVTPISASHKGSSYAEDGIRITGSREFIDSVLSRLKDLMNHENLNNRLQLVYKQSTDRVTQQPIDGWNCYVQVRERGGMSAKDQEVVQVGGVKVNQPVEV